MRVTERKAAVGLMAVTGLMALSACGSSSSGGSGTASTGSPSSAKTEVGVILPDTTSSARYTQYDAPLLTYLGVTGVHARFAATLYPAARAQAELRRVSEDANAGRRSRISILLGNVDFPQTRTVTHVLWAMFGLVTPNSVQKPHRHQSIALDFIAGCQPGCYTLVGHELDENGDIANPTRVDWETGMAFVTPPGYWHAHFNESSENAYVIPIQDAGLQTYLRTLDIRFAH